MKSDLQSKIIRAIHEPALRQDCCTDESAIDNRNAFNRRQAAVFDHASDFLASGGALTGVVCERIDWIVMVGMDGLKETARVLDVGAGCGSLIDACVKQKPLGSYVAVDLSADMLSVLSDRFPSVACVHCDVMDYSSTELFDCIWCNACFGNFYDPPAVFRHLSGLMESGSVLNISHPMGRKFQASIHETDPLTVPYLLPSSVDEANQLAEGTGVRLERFIDDNECYLVSYRHS